MPSCDTANTISILTTPKAIFTAQICIINDKKTWNCEFWKHWQCDVTWSSPPLPLSQTHTFSDPLPLGAWHTLWMAPRWKKSNIIFQWNCTYRTFLIGINYTIQFIQPSVKLWRFIGEIMNTIACFKSFVTIGIAIWTCVFCMNFDSLWRNERLNVWMKILIPINCNYISLDIGYNLYILLKPDRLTLSTFSSWTLNHFWSLSYNYVFIYQSQMFIRNQYWYFLRIVGVKFPHWFLCIWLSVGQIEFVLFAAARAYRTSSTWSLAGCCWCLDHIPNTRLVSSSNDSDKKISLNLQKVFLYNLI